MAEKKGGLVPIAGSSGPPEEGWTGPDIRHQVHTRRGMNWSRQQAPDTHQKMDELAPQQAPEAHQKRDRLNISTGKWQIKATRLTEDLDRILAKKGHPVD